MKAQMKDDEYGDCGWIKWFWFCVEIGEGEQWGRRTGQRFGEDERRKYIILICGGIRVIRVKHDFY